MDERPDRVNTRREPKAGRYGNQGIIIILVYRWLVFLFSAILCITGSSFDTLGYSILESLAVIAVYNGAVTAYCLNNGKKYAGSLLYIDIIAISLLVFFTGGVNSDLYIFYFLPLCLYGIKNGVSGSFRITGFTVVFYTGFCVLSATLFNARINWSRLVIYDLLFLMAAFAITRLSFEVKKYDEMRKKEFRLARTDKLTGLANRHYFDQKIREEVAYADAWNSVINILMFDLDNFKGYNDSYGHASGDKLLKLFSDIIKQCIRKTDIPVRYGGEEFLIMIRDMDIIIAKSVGERIRRQLEKQCIRLGNKFGRQMVTVSCGIAQYPVHSTNIKDVIEMADRALYHAKEIGRNIVVCYDEIGMTREELERKQGLG
ncbi:MAG TPA: GGDEF domain-containing protein [Clostridiales bacterium]|nr:GGDEF domain-containing protein [Clostridiales bacterium]